MFPSARALEKSGNTSRRAAVTGWLGAGAFGAVGTTAGSAEPEETTP